MKVISQSTFEWQYPAITEKFAYEVILNDPALSYLDFVYVAFPWATIIDKFHKEKENFKSVKEYVLLNTGIRRISHNTVITVCQSYHYKKLLPLYKFLGINTVFAPHVTEEEKKQIMVEFRIEVTAFPLYPVNTVKPNKEKDILYSFIGCTRYNGIDKKNVKRVKKLRKKLVFDIEHPENTIIESIDEWHFNDTVFKDQIYGVKRKESDIEDENKRTKHYKDVLSRSKYTLCPRGIGPTSIRFWESLLSNSIPVVIADDFCYPDIGLDLKSFCIQVPEKFDSLDYYLHKKVLQNFNLSKEEVFINTFRSWFKKSLSYLKTSANKNNDLDEGVNDKFNLFIPFYLEKNNTRLNEYLLCFENNINNPYIEKIFIIYEYINDDINYHKSKLPKVLLDSEKIEIKFVKKIKPRNISYLDFIKYANSVLKENDKFIIANSDIFFDDSLKHANSINLNSSVIALTRYNYKPYLDRLGQPWKRDPYSQDSWFFKVPFPEKKEFNINLGWIGCDNVIAYAFDNSGYKVLNVCKSIKTWHVHESTQQVNLYSNNYTYKFSGKPYKFLPFYSIEEVLSPHFIYETIGFEDRRAYQTLINFYKEELQKK